MIEKQGVINKNVKNISNEKQKKEHKKVYIYKFLNP
jgi:hypothetical protein